MTQTVENKTLLAVGVHAVIAMLAVGETEKAILSALTFSGCYFVFSCSSWLNEKLFGDSKASQNIAENNPDNEAK